MSLHKKFLGLITLIIGSCIMLSAFAVDPAAKESTTPPPAEGALTPDQIPPITNIGKPMPPKQPGTNTSQPTSTATPPTETAPTTPTPSTPVSMNTENNNVPDGQIIQN